MLNTTAIIFILMFLIWNIYTFTIMGVDKSWAKKNHRRVPELRLLIMALAMGGLGMLCGMMYFRHKTKHIKFVIGVPICIMLNIFFTVEGIKVL